jgi:hypothetical protein
VDVADVISTSYGGGEALNAAAFDIVDMGEDDEQSERKSDSSDPHAGQRECVEMMDREAEAGCRRRGTEGYTQRVTLSMSDVLNVCSMYSLYETMWMW